MTALICRFRNWHAFTVKSEAADILALFARVLIENSGSRICKVRRSEYAWRPQFRIHSVDLVFNLGLIVIICVRPIECLGLLGSNSYTITFMPAELTQYLNTWRFQADRSFVSVMEVTHVMTFLSPKGTKKISWCTRHDTDQRYCYN